MTTSANRQVALLRGINVGRAKRIAMADLRRLFEGLGCSDVQTLLNSGNVVFSSPRKGAANLASRVQLELEQQLGVVARALKDGVTSRNWATMLKLLALVS